MLNKIILAFLFFLSTLGAVIVLVFITIENSCSDDTISSHLSPNQSYEALVVVQDCNVTTSPVVKIKVRRKGSQSSKYFAADFNYPTNSTGQTGLDIRWTSETTISASFAMVRKHSAPTSAIEFGEDTIELEVSPK